MIAPCRANPTIARGGGPPGAAGRSRCWDSRTLRSTWTTIEKTMVMAEIKTSRARPRQHPVQSEGKEDGEQGNDVGPVARTEALSAPPDGILGKNEQIRDEGRKQQCDQRVRGEAPSYRSARPEVAIATAIQGLKTSSPRFGLKRVPSAPSSRFVDQMPDTPWNTT